MMEDDSVVREFSEDLPLMIGVSRQLRDMFRILIMYARQPPASQTMRMPLIIHTGVLNMHQPNVSTSSSLFSLSPTQWVVAGIRESDPDRLSGIVKPSAFQVSDSDFMQAHRIIQEHDGVIEIASSSLLPLQITVRFPAVGTPKVATSHAKEGATTIEDEAHRPTMASPGNAADVPSDRRRFARSTLSLATDLSIGTMLLQGTVMNIGLGGLFFVSPQAISSVEDHPVYLVLRTSVSFLELQGTAHQRSASFSEAYPTCLAITFTSLNAVDRAVLASLIQELHEPAPGVQIEGLIPQDTLTEPHSAISNSLPTEQRWHMRARLAIPVYLTRSDSGRETDRHIGLLVNLGKGGACVQTRIQTDDMPSRLFIHYMEANHTTRRRALTDDDTFDSPIACRVIWKAALTRRPDEPLSTHVDTNWQIGLQFGPCPHESEEKLNRVLFGRLLSPLELDRRTERGMVMSTTHRLRNREGHTLLVSQDYAKGLTVTHTPIVIISPGYRQSKIDYLSLAHVLALNGFRVLRYDATHALGLSEGAPHLMTLSGMQEDLANTREFVRETWPTAPVSVLASDLSARAALRFLANHQSAEHLLLLNPVLDVSDTLTRAHEHDLLGEHTAGIRRGIINVLGRYTDIDHFLVDALVGGYTDFESTVQDLNHVTSKVSFLLFSAGADVIHDIPWTQPRFLDEAQAILGNRSMALTLSSGVVDDGPVSVEAFRRNLEIIVSHCKRITMSVDSVQKELQGPDAEGLRSRHRVELEQLRTNQHVTRVTRMSLWTQHVRSSSRISEATSYLRHIDHMYQFAHPTADHSRLLDVGCGHTGFARLLLLNQFYRSRSQRSLQNPRIDYVGIDAQEDIVAASRNTLRSVQRHVDTVFSGSISGRPLLAARWLLADVDDALPFADHTFDRIVCHFTLNFSHNPLISLRELYRVLRPRGHLIMSCFTSFTDLAPSYRQHLRDINQDEFHPDSQEVLQALALLHESLRSRRLHTLSSQSLSDLVALLTIAPLLTFPTLHGQVLIATVEKPDSSG
jgi:SAM-dependent methyltransferase